MDVMDLRCRKHHLKEYKISVKKEIKIKLDNGTQEISNCTRKQRRKDNLPWNIELKSI